ncbi:hypothetical protein LCGC14_1180690 [marine sediment metagenome]|uniref:Uncharacterized protein n=1 Tax=marine sediment metagenome TaxID=412755 RepID=A0A0F9PSP8_9ZZZZ
MVAVARTVLAVDVRSADIVAGGTALTTGQTFEIAANNRTDDLLIIFEETSTAVATLVFDAGDEPPSMRAGLGSLTIAIAADDIRALVLSGGRFIQDDGTITGTLTGAGKMFAFTLPRTM